MGHYNNKQVEKFVKNKITIEAMLFDGQNQRHCINFIGEENVDKTLNYPNIITSEGVMRVNEGDYIIKEPFDKERKFYPCKPEVFNKTYSKLIKPNNKKEMQNQKVRLSVIVKENLFRPISEDKLKSVLISSETNIQTGDMIEIIKGSEGNVCLLVEVTFVQHSFRFGVEKDKVLVSFEVIEIPDTRKREIARKALEDRVKSAIIEGKKIPLTECLVNCGCGVEMSGVKEVDLTDFFKNALKEVIEERQKIEEAGKDNSLRMFEIIQDSAFLKKGDKVTLESLIEIYEERNIDRYIAEGYIKEIKNEEPKEEETYSEDAVFKIIVNSEFFKMGQLIRYHNFKEVFSNEDVESMISNGMIEYKEGKFKQEEITKVIFNQTEFTPGECEVTKETLERKFKEAHEMIKEGKEIEDHIKKVENSQEYKVDPGTKEEELSAFEINILDSTTFFVKGETVNLETFKKYFTKKSINELCEQGTIEEVLASKNKKEPKEVHPDEVKDIEILIHNLSFSKGSIVSYNQLSKSLSTQAVSNLFVKGSIKRVPKKN